MIRHIRLHPFFEAVSHDFFLHGYQTLKISIGQTEGVVKRESPPFITETGWNLNFHLQKTFLTKALKR